MLTLEAFVSGFMPFALGLGRLGHGGHVYLTSSCSILHHLAIYCHGPHRLTLLLCLGVVKCCIQFLGFPCLFLSQVHRPCQSEP